MLESSKNNRVVFEKKGVQKNFILETNEKLGITWGEFSNLLGIGQRAISDWKREKFNMSHDIAQKLAKLTKIPVPKPHKVILWKDHLSKIGKVGGKNRIELYGKVAVNEEYRSKRWKKWWNDVGRYKKPASGFQTAIKIKLPAKNKKLAEFVGIMLGDGGVAPYHIHITLSNKEKEYAEYVKSMLMSLFGTVPKLYKLRYAEAVDIVVQRKQLVDFCQSIGLVLGNKVRQQVDVPEWVKNDLEFLKVCIKGLIDTDGCFYINSYNSNGKRYSYFKIAFTNASKPLIQSVVKGLEHFGIKSRVSKNHKDVRIEEKKSVDLYIKMIGSCNSKHLEKINKYRLLRI